MSPKKHGQEELRGAKRVPRSPIHEGRFGRLFRKLPPAPDLTDSQLRALAKKMREPARKKGKGKAPSVDNPAIPAGFTYFGQFVDHDITFDPASSLQRENDPDALVDFRTPRFDLDSLYGSGPDDEPFQYDGKSKNVKFLIDKSNQKKERDLPRNEQGIALIGDKRNDENTIVSQLHLAFLGFHNKVADRLAADDSVPEKRRFAETQKLVRWHYQWVILTDYLPRLVDGELLAERLRITDKDVKIDLRWYKPRNTPFMPLEFSVAAYRFGHSQIRSAYDLNEIVTNRPIFAPGEKVGELDDLRGFRPIPRAWKVDWSFFLETGKGATPQLSRKIDTKLAAGLFDLPGFSDPESSLAFRNLKRGQLRRLPSGQDVARRMGVKVLGGKELKAPEPTPLWFYVLKEAELGGGMQLGPVGGGIVAEVLLGLLEGDPRSFVNVEPGWRPTLGPKPGQFKLADLVELGTPRRSRR